MNEFFESLGKSWRKAAERRGAKIDDPTLDPKVAEELLELARVVAHTKERRFAPLAAYTAGQAGGRVGGGEKRGAQAVAGVIQEKKEGPRRGAQAPCGGGGPGGG